MNSDRTLAMTASVSNFVAIIQRPNVEAECGEWLEQRLLGKWLARERTSADVTLYGSGYDSSSIFFHSVLIPQSDIDFRLKDAFTSWSGSPFDSASCGLVYGGSKPPRVEYSKPPVFGIQKIFANSQRLIFGRLFEARVGDKAYFELSQEITHAYGLHWVEERDAWCRLDSNGDIENVVQIQKVGLSGSRGSGVLITINRDVLEMHLAATGTCLFQMFDSICTTQGFSDWKSFDDQLFMNVHQGLIMKYRLDAGMSLFSRCASDISEAYAIHPWGRNLRGRSQAKEL